MLRIIYICLLSCSFGVLAQWNSRACLLNFGDYIHNILQDLMHELETNVKFCNLKVNDFNQTINEQMYSWHVGGSVTYANGFVTSIEDVRVTAITAPISRRVQTDFTEYFASISATLNFDNVKIGMDVITDIEGIGERQYTGVYNMDLITFSVGILKDINNNAITVSLSNSGSSARFQRVEYLPVTNVTQVLSRVFSHASMSNSYTTWARDIMLPILNRLVTEKYEFPDIRFDGC